MIIEQELKTPAVVGATRGTSSNTHNNVRMTTPAAAEKFRRSPSPRILAVTTHFAGVSAGTGADATSSLEQQ